jgi:hypothetical protein
MTLPTWLVQLGSIAGLLTLGFTLVDRLLTGRPAISLSPTDYGKRQLRCSNSSQEILIKGVSAFPAHAQFAKDDSVQGIAMAALRETFQALCAPDATRDFPIVFLDGALMAAESTKHAPFIILLWWRKTSRLWLPQFPAILFTSARSIRILDRAHEA